MGRRFALLRLRQIDPRCRRGGRRWKRERKEVKRREEAGKEEGGRRWRRRRKEREEREEGDEKTEKGGGENGRRYTS